MGFSKLCFCYLILFLRKGERGKLPSPSSVSPPLSPLSPSLARCCALLELGPGM